VNESLASPLSNQAAERADHPFVSYFLTPEQPDRLRPFSWRRRDPVRVLHHEL